MKQVTKRERLIKTQMYDSCDFERKREKRQIEKAAALIARKTDPVYIRLDKASNLTKEIYRTQKAIYEDLYCKLEQKAEDLMNLILHDLGLDENINNSITLEKLYEVFNYYENRGLNQLNSAFTDKMQKEYLPSKLTPYHRLFKNLIDKRSEFLIVAPKERLVSSAGYKKIKDENMIIALVKHLEENNIFEDCSFCKKYPDLHKISFNIKKDNLEV